MSEVEVYQLDTSCHTEFAAVDAKIIIIGVSPFAGGIIIIIVGSCLIRFCNDGRSLFLRHLMDVNGISDPLVHIGIDKQFDTVCSVLEDIIAASADNHTRF